MRRLSTFAVLNIDGGDRISFTYDEINEETEEIPGAVLPDTGGPGLAMFERYGWFLLMLALMMAGVEVRCYGERKYKRAAMTQREELEDSM